MMIQKSINEQRAREALQAGDEVFVTKGARWYESVKLRTVTRTTKTQIIIGESRYKKVGGESIGGVTGWIVAATDECRAERANAERVNELGKLIASRTTKLKETASNIFDVCRKSLVPVYDFNEAEDVTANEQVLAKHQVALDELQAILARLKGEG